MSTFYLVNLFDDTIADAVAPRIMPPQADVTGCYVVRVPDDTAVPSPTNLADLITKKYQGLLAGHGLFTQIVFDDMLDATGVDASTSVGVTLGSKGMNSLYDNGVLVTTPHAFSWGGAGAGPLQAFVTWEVYQYVDANPAQGLFKRTYKEIDAHAAPISVEVSFNGGSTFTPVTDRNFFNIAGPAQGSNLVLRFTHTGAASGRYFIGSWAVVL